MSEAPKFKRINGKQYQIELSGKWTDLDVPYGKVEALVKAFFTKGGMVDPDTGMVATDMGTLIASFGILGDILLSTYDDTGNIRKKGSCRGLEPEDVPTLFLLASEIIGNFIKVVSKTQGAAEMSPPETVSE